MEISIILKFFTIVISLLSTIDYAKHVEMSAISSVNKVKVKVELQGFDHLIILGPKSFGKGVSQSLEGATCLFLHVS